MNRDRQIEAIRAACIRANPEIVVNKHAQLIKQDHSVEYFEQCRSIRLADVLLAIGSGVRLEEQTSSGELAIGIAGRGWTRWNLRKDDLAEQSDECIAFLADLLK